MLLEKKIPVSYLFRKIRMDLLRVLVFSIVVVILKINYLEYLPQVHIALPSILGTTISLLLAFKLNQSYDRWWEARKVWGGIVNDSRTLVIQLLSFVPEDDLKNKEAEDLVKRIGTRQIAWCYSLGQSLRNLQQDSSDIYISEDDKNFLLNHQSRTVGLLALHGRDFKELLRRDLITGLQHVQLDNTLTRLCEHAGRAERIKSTVFPKTYRLFIHIFIYLFLFVLSFALVETIGYYEIPFLLLIAGSFFLIEKTATKLQDPFENRATDVPVSSIAAKIEVNIKNLMGENPVTTFFKTDQDSYYVL